MDEQKQTVAEDTESQPEAAQEETGAQENKSDDLDQLLNEFDQQASQPEPTPEPEDPTNRLQQRLEQLEAQVAQTQTQSDMQKLVAAVRGDNQVFDETFTEAWIDAEARKDPRLLKAWTDRHSNPRAFATLEKTLSAKFGDMVSKIPDPQATEDREAVTAAVQGASKKAPDAPDINEHDVAQMNDAQFEAWVRSQAAS